jgi:hypothetical protein
VGHDKPPSPLVVRRTRPELSIPAQFAGISPAIGLDDLTTENQALGGLLHNPNFARGIAKALDPPCFGAERVDRLLRA